MGPLLQRATPLPIPPERPATEFDLVVKVETPYGWLYLEDAENGYEIHANSRNDTQVSKRKTSASNNWSEGEFTTSAVNGIVTEQLVVWITASNEFSWKAKAKQLTDALDQMSYRIMWRQDNSVEYWDCQPADYSVTRQPAMQQGFTGYITAQVPRQPTVTYAIAGVDDS